MSETSAVYLSLPGVMGRSEFLSLVSLVSETSVGYHSLPSGMGMTFLSLVSWSSVTSADYLFPACCLSRG